MSTSSISVYIIKIRVYVGYLDGQMVIMDLQVYEALGYYLYWDSDESYCFAIPLVFELVPPGPTLG